MSQDQDMPITQILRAIQEDQKGSTDTLLPMVYKELRKLAHARMSKTPQGQTLQPTALVHEAYLRLVGNQDSNWEGRNHFFAAAVRAMRNILVDQARRKASVKHGGKLNRHEYLGNTPVIQPPMEDMLELDEAIKRLEAVDPRKGKIINLRYFAGFTTEETAAAMDLSVATIKREWQFIKRWLYDELSESNVDLEESSNEP